MKPISELGYEEARDELIAVVGNGAGNRSAADQVDHGRTGLAGAQQQAQSEQCVCRRREVRTAMVASGFVVWMHDVSPWLT